MTDQWLSAERIVRVVRRRRLKRSLASSAVVLAIVGTTVGLSTNASDGKQHSLHVAIQPGSSVGERLPGAIQLVGKTTPLTKVDPKATAAVADADTALAIALLHHSDLLRDENSANISTSPFSLFVALAMLENGARGATAAGIAKALQASGLDMSTQNVGLAQLISTLGQQATDDKITLETANSLWQQEGFPIKPAFLSTLSTFFHAGVWQTDFAQHNAEAIAALNAWTSEKTHGKITKLFDGLDRATVLVLTNALYFHAAWQVPFDPAETRPIRFHAAGDGAETAQFMHGPAVGVDTGTYRATAIPYLGGQFEAVAVMPDSGSLTNFVQGLSAADLDDITEKADSGSKVSLFLPKFTTTATIRLIPALGALGMHFGGDFSGIAAASDLKVDQVVQRVFLGVGEDGTTAAAVTGISAVASAAHAEPNPLFFDHPFLFLIRDKVSGAVLFASEINDPTSK